MHPLLASLPTEPRARLAGLLALAKSLQARGVDALSESELDVIPLLQADHALTERRVAGADALAKAFPEDRERHWEAAGGLGGSTPRVLDVATPAGYRKSAASGFAKAIADALAQGSRNADGTVRKALVPGSLVGFDFGAPIEALPQAPLTVAGLCTIEDTSTPMGRLLQQTARTPNAQPTPIGAQKPFSTFTTVAKDWAVATIPTLVGPIPKQWLADIADALPWLGSEAAWAVASALDTYILNGGTVEDGSTVYGALNSTGINAQALVGGDPLLTLRTAIGKLQASGVAPNGILMHSDEWTTLSTIKDSTGRYILDPAPADAVVQRLWGLPVVLSNGIPNGQALVADFTTIKLLQRSGYEAAVFEQGQATAASGTGAQRVEATDLVQTNQVMLRAEGRWGIHLASLPSITRATLV